MPVVRKPIIEVMYLCECGGEMFPIGGEFSSGDESEGIQHFCQECDKQEMLQHEYPYFEPVGESDAEPV